MKSLYVRFTPHFGSLAALSFALAVVGFGTSLSGYSQARHPVSLLGAIGVPHAQAFNLLGFVLPALLAVLVGLELRRRMPAAVGWSARIGAQLIVLSALAFAAQGLFPLDPSDLYAPGARLHAMAWMRWPGCCGGSRSCPVRCCLLTGCAAWCWSVLSPRLRCLALACSRRRRWNPE